MKASILKLINEIKSELDKPEFMDLANIKSLYKNKGEKTDLNNDRGIFLLSLLRMIKDKMILNDISPDIEDNMSDSQVGTRKDKSIRNHIFVVNSIINAVNQKEVNPIDLQVYDCAKACDSLWLAECIKDLYESGVMDDKLAMIYYGNRKNNVSIKTPLGFTERIPINDIMTQGVSLAASACSVQTDKIGKEALERNEYIYMYRNRIPVPSLTMVDDILTI